MCSNIRLATFFVFAQHTAGSNILLNGRPITTHRHSANKPNEIQLKNNYWHLTNWMNDDKLSYYYIEPFFLSQFSYAALRLYPQYSRWRTPANANMYIIIWCEGDGVVMVLISLICCRPKDQTRAATIIRARARHNVQVEWCNGMETINVSCDTANTQTPKNIHDLKHNFP